MTRKAVLFVLLCAVMATAMPALAQSAAALPAGVQKVGTVEGITEYRLSNGLRVVLFPDPTKSNITVNVTIMVGSRHEDYGETGMAHLLEHLLFKGSTNHPDIKKELDDHGTRPNGTTSFDRTNYFETFTATDDNLKWALEMEADRMVNSFIAKKDLDTEMTVVRNEFEMGENQPQSVLYKRMLATAYDWHNYGNTPIGARSDIENVPIDRLQAFYRHFYQPDNAVLVVAGKFDEAKALGMIANTFGKIPAPTRPLRKTYTTEPTQDGERTVTLKRVGDVQALGMLYKVPPGTSEEYVAVDMVNRMMGDQPSGRLYKALVETKKAASTSMGGPQLKDAGFAVAFAEVRTENSLDDAKTAMIGVFDELQTKPFTQEDLDRVKTQALKNFDLMFNNSEVIALTLSNWQSMGDWRMLFLNRDRIKNVTLDQVNKAAKKYYIPSNRTVAMFIPDKNPVRAEIPAPPDVVSMLKDYKGGAAVAQGEAFDASPDNIDKRTIRGDLAGGLKVSFIEKKTRGNQVNAVLNFRFGDEVSLKNKQYAASLAGQMLMRGTQTKSRQQIKDEFDKLKANVMIYGGPTNSGARITTTRENLKPVMELVAEVLKTPSFPASEFDQLKQQTLAQLENSKSEPQALAMNGFQKHISPYPKDDVRYAASIDEQIDAIKAVTLDDVKAFYKDFYGANTGEVTIIGDFDAEGTQKLIGDQFNGWKSPKKYARVPRPYNKVAPEQKVIETPDKANAMWVAGVPIQIKDTNPDYPALLLGNYILGQGMNSHLFSRIRDKEGLSYGVGSAINVPSEDDGGVFMAYAISAPQNAPKVEASFKDEVNKILTQGYTKEEVEAAKKAWAQSRQVSRANDNELVGRMNNNRYLNRTMQFDKEIEAKVMALTPEQIRTAMAKYIDLSLLNIYRAGDFQKANVTF